MKLKKITWQDIGLTRLVIIFLCGVFLLILSLPTGTLSFSGSKKKAVKTTDSSASYSTQDVASFAMTKYVSRQEKEVENILSEVNGIGAVKVMLTLSASEEKVTLKNDDVTNDSSKQKDSTGGNRNDSKYSSKSDSVLVDGENGQEPYVVQVQSPTVGGVVVVAQGAGQGTVDTEIIEAVEALFQIEPHKIKVMKMQS